MLEIAPYPATSSTCNAYHHSGDEDVCKVLVKRVVGLFAIIFKYLSVRTTGSTLGSEGDVVLERTRNSTPQCFDDAARAGHLFSRNRVHGGRIQIKMCRIAFGTLIGCLDNNRLLGAITVAAGVVSFWSDTRNLIASAAAVSIVKGIPSSCHRRTKRKGGCGEGAVSACSTSWISTVIGRLSSGKLVCSGINVGRWWSRHGHRRPRRNERCWIHDGSWSRRR
jgi:hypothetical protein